jgi:hypothetical protein
MLASFLGVLPILTPPLCALAFIMNYAQLCPLPPVLCLLKLIAHVCTLKVAEGELSVYPASSHGMS